MTTMTVTVEREGFTLSKLIWKTFRRQPTGYIEKCLERNPGVSAYVELPVGLKLTFPVEEAVQDTQAPRTVIRLWS